jgi:hypothetical protein
VMHVSFVHAKALGICEPVSHLKFCMSRFGSMTSIGFFGYN